MTKHAGVTSVKLGFSFASNCASMTDLIARSVNRSKTADMRCSPRLLLTIPTHLLPPLRWLVRVGVVIIFCPPLLLAREEEFKKLVVLQVNIFNALFYPSFSQNLSSLFLFLSLCVRGKNNNAVSLSLSIYLSIYLFTRVVASSTMIFFLTARTNEAHTHTPDDDDDDDGSFVRWALLLLVFGASTQTLSLSFCTRKKQKKS
jgi:hypothetical protein